MNQSISRMIIIAYFLLSSIPIYILWQESSTDHDINARKHEIIFTQNLFKRHFTSLIENGKAAIFKYI